MSKQPTSAEIAWMDKEYQRLAPLLDKYVADHPPKPEDPRKQLALDALNRISEI